jgi:hypothetical protein
MGTMRIEVAHRLFPRTRRILVWHREHSLDQIGNRSGIPGLFFRGDGPNATGRIIARYAMPRRRVHQLRRGRFRRTAHSGLLIEVFHFLRPQRRDQNSLTNCTPISLGAEAWLMQLQPSPLDVTPCCDAAITRGKGANVRPMSVAQVIDVEIDRS